MRLALLLFAGITAYAQTAVKTDQIRTSPASSARILAFKPSGELAALELGPGIQITGNMITVVQPAPELIWWPVFVSERLTREPDGTYKLVSGLVIRNGMIQEAGKDYTVSPTLITPSTPWAADDVVLAITVQKSAMTATARRTP